MVFYPLIENRLEIFFDVGLFLKFFQLFIKMPLKFLLPQTANKNGKNREKRGINKEG